MSTLPLSRIVEIRKAFASGETVKGVCGRLHCSLQTAYKYARDVIHSSSDRRCLKERTYEPTAKDKGIWVPGGVVTKAFTSGDRYRCVVVEAGVLIERLGKDA